jgi:endogenous inhibitor of DNA gyrase (YacG/DUF329 family)
MIDLGLWAGGDYSIAGGPVEDREHPDDRGGTSKPTGNGSKE